MSPCPTTCPLVSLPFPPLAVARRLAVLSPGAQPLGLVPLLAGHHNGALVYTTDMVFWGCRLRDVCSLLDCCHAMFAGHGLNPWTVAHADFEVATSAVHMIASRGVNKTVTLPSDTLPCTLAHVICATSDTYNQEIEAVPPLVPPVLQTWVLFWYGLLHPSGLWDVMQPDIHIACWSVFK